APAGGARLIEGVPGEAPPRPRKLDPHIPRDLETIVLKAMAKDPAERYPSAEALAEDLRRFLADRPIRARRSTVAEQAWRWCRRNPAVATLTASVALLLVILAIGASVAAVWLGLGRGEARGAKVKLGEQHKATLAERERAARAEGQVREGRWNAYLANLRKAQAARWSGQPGRRFDSLKALAEAAEAGRALGMSTERTLELRN